MRKSLLLISLISCPALSLACNSDSKMNKVVNNELYFQLNSIYSFNNLGKNNLNSSSQIKKEKTDNNLAYNIGVGYRISNNYRASIEFTNNSQVGYNVDFRKGLFDVNSSVKLDSKTILANIYYDFNEIYNSGIKPFIFAGAGISSNKSSDFSMFISEAEQKIVTVRGRSKISPAFNVGFGVSKELSNRVNLDLSYRYLHSGSFKSSNVSNVGNLNSFYKINNLKSHQIMVGLRVKL